MTNEYIIFVFILIQNISMIINYYSFELYGITERMMKNIFQRKIYLLLTLRWATYNTFIK